MRLQDQEEEGMGTTQINQMPLTFGIIFKKAHLVFPLVSQTNQIRFGGGSLYIYIKA